MHFLVFLLLDELGVRMCLVYCLLLFDSLICLLRGISKKGIKSVQPILRKPSPNKAKTEYYTVLLFHIFFKHIFPPSSFVAADNSKASCQRVARSQALNAALRPQPSFEDP